jgi:hypothetical protein
MIPSYFVPLPKEPFSYENDEVLHQKIHIRMLYYVLCRLLDIEKSTVISAIEFFDLKDYVKNYISNLNLEKESYFHHRIESKLQDRLQQIKETKILIQDFPEKEEYGRIGLRGLYKSYYGERAKRIIEEMYEPNQEYTVEQKEVFNKYMQELINKEILHRCSGIMEQ